MVTYIFSTISLVLSLTALALSAICFFDNKKTITSQHEELMKRDRIDNLIKTYMTLWLSRTDSHIHALSTAGAANLHSDDELIEACTQIENRAGNGHPLMKYKDQITKAGILKFFKKYASENNPTLSIEEVIERMSQDK